ncbi:MAG: RNA polymerase sigma-70 factor [Parabacteroides gordonii]|uniref:RNA polymerase sigma-70 factor n=1 Tax=Parabacteroides gordonii TaxID=574930 RepID=UPI003A880507
MIDIRDEIVELQKGSHKSFEILFRRYYVLLCYEARSYITEKHIIEELVGDVFRWLWENRDTLEITTSIRAYLIKATHNACLSYLRKNQLQYIELEEVKDKNTLFSLDESPLDYVLSRELIERVDKAVKELPPQYKKVFELSRYKNLTYAEISAEMGVSVNAVKLYQKKALAQLRLVLKDYLPASLD